MVSRLSPDERRAMVPETLAAQWRCIPLAVVDDAIYLATDHPDVWNAVQGIQRHLDRPVVPVPVTLDRLRWHAARTYADGILTSPVWQRHVPATPDTGVQLDETERAAKDKPIVRLVDEMLSEAVKRRASDVHLEPEADGLRVRFRLDGLLVTRAVLSKAEPVVGRIKILSRLNLAERRLPQDGRLTVNLPDRAIDLRVSTFPTLYGEKVVLRLLDRDPVLLEPRNLGMPERVLNEFLRAIQLTRGMVLVTGPTGSGKTTTLYSALSHINAADVNILTIEDPIEYALHGINQTQIQEEIGLSFGIALRHALRQDPDIIMVGEIRDKETAEIALRAALTGHLVLSTLHTNDAASALARLIEIGVEASLLATCLELVLGQRLVRRLCTRCRTVHHRQQGEEYVPAMVGTAWQEAVGCDHCASTGYQGRQGIFECLRADEPLKELLVDRPTSGRLRAWMNEQGFKSIEQAGWDLVASGTTSPQEYLRVLGG
jgi:type IV pilus assembly protein PilB